MKPLKKINKNKEKRINKNNKNDEKIKIKTMKD